MVSVHPARWCTSPLGVVPAGLGDGVGHCHDVAKLPRVCLFISLLVSFLSFWGTMLYSFFRSIILGIFVLLDMQVAKWVPTSCYNDAYSVGTPKWAFWEKGWQRYHETTFSPFFGRFFLVSKRTFYFFWGLYVGCYILGGPGILGLALAILSLVSYPLNLLMFVAGLLLVIWRWIPVLSFLLLLSTG